MSRTPYLVLILSLVRLLSIDALAADQNQCVFNNHAKATAYIEYKYKDSTGASDTVQGSGFVITADGHILTANHVLRPEQDGINVVQESVSVRLESITYPAVDAIIIDRNKDLDLALLKIPTKTEAWPVLPIGNSTLIRVGSPITGLGYPQSDLAVVPTSIVTSNNAVVHGVTKPFWQTSLPLAHGDSGGPIFGPLGTVVGVAEAVRENNVLISYVIPLHYAAALFKEGGAELSPFGSCFEPPECRDPSHGVESYSLDQIVGSWSDWRGGGYNRNAYCNDYLGQLAQIYPNSKFIKTRDDEGSRESGFRHFEYRYYCEFRREEGPQYRKAAGVECMSKEAKP